MKLPDKQVSQAAAAKNLRQESRSMCNRITDLQYSGIFQFILTRILNINCMLTVHAQDPLDLIQVSTLFHVLSKE
jgi:hypothetical protein